MSKITILHEYPVVLTKNKQWFEINRPMMKPGAVIVLPEDAVLVIPPQSIELRVDSKVLLGASGAPQKEVE